MADDIEDVYRELEAELDDMDLNYIESTVIKLKNNLFHFPSNIISINLTKIIISSVIIMVTIHYYIF